MEHSDPLTCQIKVTMFLRIETLFLLEIKKSMEIDIMVILIRDKWSLENFTL